MKAIPLQAENIDFILCHQDLFRRILSVHYPFCETQLKAYWSNIFFGDAYYSFYLGDTETLNKPAIGLCYNENIEWTPWVRSHWYFFDPNSPESNDINFEQLNGGDFKMLPIGWFNPFDGEMVGFGSLPLSLKEEVGINQNIIYMKLSRDFSSEDYFEELEAYFAQLSEEIPSRDFNYIEELINSGKEYLIIKNRSIWINTLSKMVNPEIVDLVFK